MQMFHDPQSHERSFLPLQAGDTQQRSHPPSTLGIRLPWSENVSGVNPITVRLADIGEQRNSARMLVNKMYSTRGYGDQHVIPQTPTHTTFSATAGPETIGTITLAVDSSAGLAADAIFKDEIDTFRQVPGAKVCELTKLAFDTTAPSKPLLASMFHLVFIYGQRRHDCTDLFIEVNPRHTRFYEAMLGFKRVGNLKINASVAAPAQLLNLKVSTIRAEINRLAGIGENSTSRSLYPYFFSPKEEDGIYSRMTSE
ncbi:acetyltransferase [Sphingomonas qilianensis]|uniref:Acetyltransferase n=1 Tax=Sphingomonas qilianensis TaxID=1736690 RepID=A0ABU9XQ89_9SPHN